MPMGYNPNEVGEKPRRATAGVYDFVVESVQETTFRSGNRGAKGKLQVAAFPDKDITVFVSFVYTPTALWKLDQFLTSVGQDFNNPPEPEHLTGMKGKAEFTIDEKGYLEAGKFLPAMANNGPDARMSYPMPQSIVADDVPF